MFRRLIVVCVGVVLLVAATPAAADCPELVGRMPGPLSVVAVAGDYAYLGGATGLFIADISDPTTPRLVGEVGFWGWAREIAVSDGYAYVALGSGGLRVIDVSTPSLPVEVGSFAPLGKFIHRVAVAGNYAYVADDGLRVIDVSSPSAPVEVGYVDTPVDDVAVSGSYAYVGGGYPAGLRVIDVSTPSAPVQVGYVETPYGTRRVAVSDGYAYVAGGGVGGGLHVIDVRTPSAPVEVGFVLPTGETLDVAVVDDYAYVIGGPQVEGGLHVIDVSVPSAPVEVGFINLPSAAVAPGIAVDGRHAYVGRAYLTVIDVSEPSAPLEVGSIDTPGLTIDVAAASGYAYVADAYGLLEVFDVSTPSAPTHVSWVELQPWEASLADIVIAEEYAYVVTSDLDHRYQFSVLDISTPSEPEAVGSLSGLGFAWVASAVVSGDYAYVAGGRILVIDVSVPSAPVEVWFGDTWFANDVAVSGGYAYFADFSGGLRVIDVSTPSAPVEIGYLETPGETSAISVFGSHAYLAGSGFTVIDISSPSAPFEIGFVDTPGHAYDVVVSDGLAYVAAGASPQPSAGAGSLQVIDVSTPSAPVVVGSHQTLPHRSGVYSGGISVSDGYAYLAAGDAAGLYVFRDCAEHGPEKMPHPYPYPSSVD